MFKSVEYAGFEGRPELRARAEQLNPVLANEIGTWRGDVDVRWSIHPTPDEGVLDLGLALVLPNGVSAACTETFVRDDFAHARRLGGRCNRAWSDLLGVLLDKQHQRVTELLSEPVGV